MTMVEKVGSAVVCSLFTPLGRSRIQTLSRLPRHSIGQTANSHDSTRRSELHFCLPSVRRAKIDNPAALHSRLLVRLRYCPGTTPRHRNGMSDRRIHQRPDSRFHALVCHSYQDARPECGVCAVYAREGIWQGRRDGKEYHHSGNQDFPKANDRCAVSGSVSPETDKTRLMRLFKCRAWWQRQTQVGVFQERPCSSRHRQYLVRGL